MFNCWTNSHSYSLAVTGLKMKNKVFSTREEANQMMYKIMAKYHLTLQKVFDDNHDKTYVCDNGVRFYIQRAFE